MYEQLLQLKQVTLFVFQREIIITFNMFHKHSLADQFGPFTIIKLCRSTGHFQTLEVDRFSSWKRLVRVTAFVLRAIKKFKGLRFCYQAPNNVTNCRNVTPSPTKFHSSSFRSLSPRHAVPFPSADEMSDAKIILLLASQKENFQNEIRSLSNKRFIAPKSRLRNLKPFLDADNCLRAEGRLRKSPFDYCLKHSIILDGHNRIIQLFIEFVHSSNGHTRLKQTQHILQLEYWILSAGSVI